MSSTAEAFSVCGQSGHSIGEFGNVFDTFHDYCSLRLRKSAAVDLTYLATDESVDLGLRLALGLLGFEIDSSSPSVQCIDRL